MTGRRFRIVSDDDDEVIIKDATTCNTRMSEQGSEVVTLDLREIPDAKKNKKRARLVSDDSSDHDIDVRSGTGPRECQTNNSHNDQFTGAHVSSIRNDQQTFEDTLSEDEMGRVRIGVEDSYDKRAVQSYSDRIPSAKNQPKGSGAIQATVENEMEVAHDGFERKSCTEQSDKQEDEAEEATERTVVKKRVVKNPQPKLDAARLTGKRGLGRLQNLSSNIHLRGKGHEHQDVKCILHNIQLWGHRLFPKMQLKDVLERCEKLGTKMPVRVYLRKMRKGEVHDCNRSIVESEEDITRGVHEIGKNENASVPEGVGETQPQAVADTGELFQELLQQHYIPRPDSISERGSETIKVTSSEQNELIAKIQAKRVEALKKRELLRAQREAQEREELIEAQMTCEMEAMTSRGGQ